MNRTACSRHGAEYRLLLRHDNADRRLTPLGRRVGLVDGDTWASFQKKERSIEELTRVLRTHRLGQDTLEHLLRRPEVDWKTLQATCSQLGEWPARVVEQVELETKYAGYIHKQAQQVERFQRMEARAIPSSFDYHAIPQLRAEAKEKLSQIKPGSLGQASRVSGINPADLAVLLIYLEGRGAPAGNPEGRSAKSPELGKKEGIWRRRGSDKRRVRHAGLLCVAGW